MIQNKHLFIEDLFIFNDKRKKINLNGYYYDFFKGGWINKNDNTTYLVISNDPNKPLAGTKKCDQETGEDQKGE